MSIELMEHVMTLRHITGTPYYVLLMVAWFDRGPRGDGCRASIETLAAHVHVHARTVQYALKHLLAMGAIYVENNRVGGRGKVTTYRVKPPGKRVAPPPPFPAEKGGAGGMKRVALASVKGGHVATRTVEPYRTVGSACKKIGEVSKAIRARSLPRVDYSDPRNRQAHARQKMSPAFIAPELMMAAEDVRHPVHARAVQLALEAARAANVEWHPPPAPPMNGTAPADELPAANVTPMRRT